MKVLNHGMDISLETNNVTSKAVASASDVNTNEVQPCMCSCSTSTQCDGYFDE